MGAGHPDDARLNEEAWQPQGEILRLDTTPRTRLGWPLRMDALAQPWTQPKSPPTHTLSLRLEIQSEIEVQGACLALEGASGTQITLDGNPISAEVSGYWVDPALETVALPLLKPGTHTLEVTLPYGPEANPEWMYLLGDFGVRLSGRHATLTAPVHQLAWGDWTSQGLPFYAGNVTYHATLEGTDLPTVLEVAHFKAPLLNIVLDGLDRGPLAFAPYQLELGMLKAREHRLDLTAFGSRVNAFRPLHNSNPDLEWVGLDAWRSSGVHWSDEPQPKPVAS